MNLYTIDTEFFKLDGGAMFGTVPKTIWQKTNPPDENNLCDLAMRCLLIEDENRLILIDTGMGNKYSEKTLSYYYVHGENTMDKSLAKHGFSRNDITDVFLTHLHLDHAGGAFLKNEHGQIVSGFPNALFWSNEVQFTWAYFDPNEREKPSFLKENLTPIYQSGKLKMIPCEDGFQFTPNIKIRFANGHTRGLMMPQINYHGKTLFYVADLICLTSHLPIGYLPSYDVEPLESMKEKKKYLQEMLDNNYVLFFEHDPLIECASLQMTEKGIRIKDTFKLSEWI